MDIESLINIASKHNFDSIREQLEIIRDDKTDKPLNVMLIGDYSSGKSTFINALLDNPCLEVNDNPTTSIICSIQFGCSRFKISGIDENGSTIPISLFTDETGKTSYHNKDYEDKVIAISIEDTSTRIPSNVILYDTPGIMSLDPKHRKVLLSVLPQGDVFFVVCSAHTASIGRELINFIKENKIDSNPINVIYTHCDQKNPHEVSQLPKIAKNTKNLSIMSVCCTAAGAKDPSFGEFFNVLERIRLDKAQYQEIKKKKRIETYRQILIKRLEECINESENVINNGNIANAQRLDLMQIEHKINSTAEDFRDDLLRKTIDIKDEFLSIAKKSLTAIATNIAQNRRDILFRSQVSSIRTSAISNLAKKARMTLLDFSDKNIETVNDIVSMEALAGLTLPSFDLTALDYIPELSTIGHKYDRVVALSIKSGLTLLTMYAQSQGVPVPNANTIIKSIPTSNQSSQSVISEDISLTSTKTDNPCSSPATIQPNSYPYPHDSSIDNTDSDIAEEIIGNISDDIAVKQRIDVVLDFVSYTLSNVIQSDLREYTDLITTNVKNSIRESARVVIEEINSNINDIVNNATQTQHRIEQMNESLILLKNETN